MWIRYKMEMEWRAREDIVFFMVEKGSLVTDSVSLFTANWSRSRVAYRFGIL